MEGYNAAVDLLGRNLPHRGAKIAVIDDRASITYAELEERTNRFVGFLQDRGVPIESRVLICMQDTINFPVVCLGAIKAGLVPVLVNPLLTSVDLDYILWDCRARVLVASAAAWPALAPVIAGEPNLDHILVADGEVPAGAISLADVIASSAPTTRPAATRADEPCLWQYSSGTTGRPKGTIHTHHNVREMMRLYPREVLRINETDVTFSAAKLFFGYGFGNGIVFPFSVGATAILMAGRPTPDAVWELLTRHQPTIFFGVPTLYASLLDFPDPPGRGQVSIRICTSAGEALPASLGQRWKERYGVDILDGIGSTEMFHIFLTNRTEDVVYGTTGRPVSGYELRVVDEDGTILADGEIGELQIKGPTSAIGYWCNREKSQATFLGAWTRSGDKFYRDSDGRFHYCGRSDDMLKVGGIYVSPFEVESALVTHEAVREAAVVGWKDDQGLVKPKAFVVLQEGKQAGSAIENELKQHVKAVLAPYKYPRWFEFVESLPKTATGKVERYKLRQG